jgi:hypothetical protein
MDASPLFHASNYRENANAPAAYNPVGKTAAAGGRYSFTKTPSGSRGSKNGSGGPADDARAGCWREPYGTSPILDSATMIRLSPTRTG